MEQSNQSLPENNYVLQQTVTEFQVDNHSYDHNSVEHWYNYYGPGVHFNPEDYQLILDYLSPMINNEKESSTTFMHVVNIYSSNPEDLTAHYPPQGDDKKWYFITSRDRKYPNGSRPARKAGAGYWKATGSDILIKHGGVQVGSRKSLVYYKGKPSEGVKTRWIMHEFRVVLQVLADDNDDNNTNMIKISDDHENINMRLDDYVLCRIYKNKKGQSKNKRKRNDDQSTESSSSSVEMQYMQWSHPPRYRIEVDDPVKYVSCLPSGFNFTPYDYELILDFLIPKVNEQELLLDLIYEDNIYNFNPEYLAANYQAQGGNSWYFFTTRDRKYPNGSRPDRKAGDGYWKATGADVAVKYKGIQVGSRKSLVYYEGKPSEGVKMQWMMHEFKVVADSSQANNAIKTGDDNINTNMRLDGCVLCRIYKTERTQRKKGGRNDDNMQGGGGEEEQAPPPDDQFLELISYFNDDTNDTPSLACILGTMNNDANNNIVDNKDDVCGGSVFYVNDDHPPQAYQHDPPPPPPPMQATPQPVQSFQNSSSMFQHYYAPRPLTQAAPQPVESFQNSSSTFQAAAQTFRIQQRMMLDAYLAQPRLHPSFAVPQQPHTSRGAEEEEEEEEDDNDDNMQGGEGGEQRRPDHLSFTLDYFESLNTYNTNPNNNNNIVYNDEDNNNNDVGAFEEKNERLEYIRAMFLTDDLPLRLREAFSRSDNYYDTQIRCQDLCCPTSDTHMNPLRPPPQATAQTADDALQNSSMFQAADDPSDAMFGQDETFEQRITDEEEYDAMTPQDQTFDEWLIANEYSDAMPQQDQATIQQQSIDDELIPPPLDDVPQQPYTSIQHCTCDQCLPYLSFEDVQLLLQGR